MSSLATKVYDENQKRSSTFNFEYRFAAISKCGLTMWL